MSQEAPAPALGYGRYRLLGRIGAGRITEAFKAKSFGVEGFEKLLVVKRVHAGLASDATFLQGFVREAKLAVRLSHANVVQVFDLGRVESTDGVSYFMATEFVAGVDLDWLLESAALARRALPVAMCVYVAAEIAKALDHAHRRRDERMQSLAAAHANLTAHNVLISWDGEVKVSDFCVARALTETQLGAPGAGAAAADLRALGALLSRALSLGAERDVPFDLVRLVARALSPSQGFATAADLHEALLECAYGDSGICDGPELAELLELHGTLAAQPGARDVLASAPRALSNVHIFDSLPPREGEPGLTLRIPSSARLPEGAPGAGEPASEREQEHALAERAVALASEPAAGRAAAAPSAGNWPKPGEEREASLLVLRPFGGAPLPSHVRENAREILRRYGAHVVASEPEELIAAFGLEQADARDTENAVRCGLVLSRSLAQEPQQTGLGIDAGGLTLTASGGVGADECLETARRLAEAALRRLAISERAHANLRGQFAVGPLASGSTPAFLVGEPRELDEVLGRFVGRKTELTRMGELLARASTRRLTTLGLIGEHGIGKTRLLVETRARLAERAFNVGFYMAACPPRGRQNPYSAIAAMLRVLCGVHEGDTAEQVRAHQPRLRALGLTDAELEEVFAALQSPAAPPASAREALVSAVTRMFYSLSEDRLHVFVWDDADELDGESAALLLAACERLGHTRAMLAFAARSAEAAPFRELPAYAEIALPNMPAEDVRRLVAWRLGTRELPEALLEFLQNRAAGHPLFTEELLRQVFDAGAVVLREGRLEVRSLEGTLGVPRSLRTLLAARLQRVPESEYRLLLAVAMLGAHADVALCAALLEIPLVEVNRLAAQLVNRELLFRDGPVTLSFRSPLLAELLVSGLTLDMRRALHRRVLRAYRSVWGAGAEDQATHLAEHLDTSNEENEAALPSALPSPENQ